MTRYGMIAYVKSDKLDEYKRLHADAWPGVLAMIRACNIRNYSIFLSRLPDGQALLFSYFEYAGTDFGADMTRMAADPTTQRWWSVCKPCLEPVAPLPPGEVWAPMESIFRFDG